MTNIVISKTVFLLKGFKKDLKDLKSYKILGIVKLTKISFHIYEMVNNLTEVRHKSTIYT